MGPLIKESVWSKGTLDDRASAPTVDGPRDRSAPARRASLKRTPAVSANSLGARLASGQGEESVQSGQSSNVADDQVAPLPPGASAKPASAGPRRRSRPLVSRPLRRMLFFEGPCGDRVPSQRTSSGTTLRGARPPAG